MPVRPPWNTNANLRVTNPLLALLESCASFAELLRIQARLTVTGLIRHRFPASRVLAFCALSRPPRLAHALALFSRFPDPNPYMHNLLLRAYTSAALPRAAFSLFSSLVAVPVSRREAVDDRTFLFALKACQGLLPAASCSHGECIHCVALKVGFCGRSLIAGNGLVGYYGNCRRLVDARKVFDEMTQRDVVSWTTAIDACVKNGRPGEAVRLFHKMLALPALGESVLPNEVTLITSLSAFSQIGLFKFAMSMHEYVTQVSNVSMSLNLQNALIDMLGKCGCMVHARREFDRMEVRDVYSWTSLINGYAKCGDLETALELFETMPARNAVSWSCMIAAYSQADQPKEAVQLFHKMLSTGIEPIDATLVSVVSACSQLGYSNLGAWIHDTYILSGKINCTLKLANAFIDMFAKCGDIGMANKLFGDLKTKDIVSWNSMITGYAYHGYYQNALSLFEQLVKSSIKLDNITFVGVLSSCTHGGLVSEGRKIFREMKALYGVEPSREHYSCMIDLLGKAGLLEDAFELVKTMPMEPDEAAWGALLNACKMHGDVKSGKFVGDKLLCMDPGDSGIYTLLANLYSMRNKWDDVTMVRRMMRSYGIKKVPGSSLVEVCGELHELSATDVSHPQVEEIYAALGYLTFHLRWEGYVPVT